jgi:hypothetical protein
MGSQKHVRLPRFQYSEPSSSFIFVIPCPVKYQLIRDALISYDWMSSVALLLHLPDVNAAILLP